MSSDSAGGPRVSSSVYARWFQTAWAVSPPSGYTGLESPAAVSGGRFRETAVMNSIRTVTATAAGLAVLTCLPGLSAGQTAPAAAGHVHYAEPPRPALQASPSGALAPRLQNLGVHAFVVTTSSRQAQRFMNQGLNLAYAFNHAEARRAFREAARLDPNLAMAYWGQALVLGPNINAAMEPNEEPRPSSWCSRRRS